MKIQQLKVTSNSFQTLIMHQSWNVFTTLELTTQWSTLLCLMKRIQIKFTSVI